MTREGIAPTVPALRQGLMPVPLFCKNLLGIPMSEYQYYEFRALERPLSKTEQAELRNCSSRASITSSRFVNEYHWGDFRGEPEEWMRRYFDAHLYFANWGSSSLMLRFPLSALDETMLAEFVQPTLSDAGSGFGDALELITTAEHRILAWRFNDDSGYGDRFCDEEGAEWLDRLLPLRDELLGGDTRPLYLGWLARVCAGELGDDDVEPPLPAGLASLTPAQQALVEYLQLDPDWLEVAAQASPPLQASATEAAEGELWLAEQAPETLRASVALLLAGRAQEAQHGVRQAYLVWQAARRSSAEVLPRRTLAQISAGMDRAREQRLAREKVAQAALAARQQAAREAQLVKLAARQAQVWQEIDASLQRGSGVGYDQALRLIVELYEALMLVGQGEAYLLSLARLMKVHGTRKAWVARLQKAGLLH